MLIELCTHSSEMSQSLPQQTQTHQTEPTATPETTLPVVVGPLYPFLALANHQTLTKNVKPPQITHV